MYKSIKFLLGYRVFDIAIRAAPCASDAFSARTIGLNPAPRKTSPCDTGDSMYTVASGQYFFFYFEFFSRKLLKIGRW